MGSKPCINRLQKEYKALLKEPVPNIKAVPSASSLLVWHYVLEGPKGSEYEEGYYWGKIEFPSDYPYKPPAISMFTPSGRFKTNTQLCMSMTNYHPESWNPMWSVGTILNGLLSFMQESAISTGSISASQDMRRQLAQESLQWNATNLTFKKLFPEYMEQAAQQASSRDAFSGHQQTPAEASAAAPEAGAGGTRHSHGGTQSNVPRHAAASQAARQQQRASSGNEMGHQLPRARRRGQWLLVIGATMAIAALLAVPLLNGS